jgi:hypothetical protein
MTWAIQAAVIWLLISACSVTLWAVGYRMGYRRRATDAIANDIPKADHRFNGE